MFKKTQPNFQHYVKKIKARAKKWVYKIEKRLRYEPERGEVKNHLRSEWENSWRPGGCCKHPSGVKGQSPLWGPEVEPPKSSGFRGVFWCSFYNDKLGISQKRLIFTNRLLKKTNSNTLNYQTIHWIDFVSVICLYT